MTMSNNTQPLNNINLDETSACINHSEKKEAGFSLVKYVLIGMLFGIVFVKAEIISWYRIQEMFLLQSFHMYGVIGTAVTVGFVILASALLGTWTYGFFQEKLPH